ncbi:MAG: hypothetical protein PHS37_06025, partial [Candidatus Omnitrophica bacterium]|nr:hypothetical protein [Candidatus Omnitrophota bacterium]
SVPVYTSIDQGLSLDQSFSGQGVAGGYSSPDNTPDAGMTLGGTTGQEFASGTDPLETPFTDTSLDAPTFAQTALASNSTATSGASAYSATLNIDLAQSDPSFQASNSSMSITLAPNHTWSATLSGSIGSTLGAGWFLCLTNQNDKVTLINGSQNDGSEPWTADIDSANSTVNGKTLTGTKVEGTTDAGLGPPAWKTSTIEGTWN